METILMLKVAYNESVMSRTSMFRWYNQFSLGRELVEDKERSGIPCTTKTDENIVRAAIVLKKHRSVDCRLVEELTGIPKRLVQQIIKNDSRKRNLCLRFVPHALTVERQ